MFKNFDFIGHKKIWFTFSGIMIILSIISIILFRFNWGIDFTGGTILELGFDKNVTVEEVRDGLREDGLQTATIQLSGNMSGETSNDVIIRTRNLSSEEAQTVVGHVKDKVGSGDVKRIETVGAVIGSEVTRSTLLNVLISFGAMILYMSIRFEHRIAISAIVAICHDILMVLGVFAFFHLEVDASFLAAILTVLGYSMNESVVIFDRIRENRVLLKGMNYREVVNLSLNQTLARTILTSLTVVLVLVMQLCFGGASIRDFVFVMLVGVVVGTFSTIFVSTIIVAYWHKDKNASDSEPEKKAENKTIPA